MIRKPAVAGQFYSGTKNALIKELNIYFNEAQVKEKRKVVGIISPHAGYMYSGGVAAKVYAGIQIPAIALILAPNHTGLGKNASIITEGSFEIPLGEIPIAKKEARNLLSRSSILNEDALAHTSEHSLEVQLPFIKTINPDFKLIPITLKHLTYSMCETLGNEIASVISENKEKYLIVASSDMNHFESQNVGNRKDKLAIERVLALDPRGLSSAVSEHDISMCGVIPATVMLIAAKSLGAKNAELINYKTSGDITGDYSSVVGYAGLVVY